MKKETISAAEKKRIEALDRKWQKWQVVGVLKK